MGLPLRPGGETARGMTCSVPPATAKIPTFINTPRPTFANNALKIKIYRLSVLSPTLCALREQDRLQLGV